MESSTVGQPMESSTVEPSVESFTAKPSVESSTAKHSVESSIVELSTQSPIVEHSKESPIVEHSTESSVVEHSIESSIVEQSSDSFIVEPSMESPVVEHSMESLSEPGTSCSRKSDADLLREYGIDRDCSVVLSPNTVFLSKYGRRWGIPMPKKAFRVHYGRHFLWQIASLSYRHPVSSIDLDRLYSTYITSRFSTLDRPRFKSILRSYFAQWEWDFEQRRAQLVQAKLEELSARRKAERDAQRLCKITYRDTSVIVPRGHIEQAKLALRNESRSRVLLERIFVDEAPVSNPEVTLNDDINLPYDTNPPIGSPQSTTDVSENNLESLSSDEEPAPTAEDSTDQHSSQSSQGTISPERDSQLTFFGEKREACWISIDVLVTDMINKVSDELDEQGVTSNPDTSSTDCYSNDTVESPMEVEFGSGESPDFSKVLRDSEETCHGDEFYEVARAKQGLPNGNADKGSCVLQKTLTRSHDKPIVVRQSVKL